MARLTTLQQGWLSRIVGSLGMAAFLTGAMLAMARLQGSAAPLASLPVGGVILASIGIGFAIAVTTVTRAPEKGAKTEERTLPRPVTDPRMWVTPVYAVLNWFLASEQRLEGLASAALLALGFALGYTVRLVMARPRPERR